MFLPLTVGGKINSLKNAETFIRSGADKLVINSAIYNNSSIIKKITELFGSQAVVASIDYKEINGKPTLFVNNGQFNTKIKIFDWIKNVKI